MMYLKNIILKLNKVYHIISYHIKSNHIISLLSNMVLIDSFMGLIHIILGLVLGYGCTEIIYKLSFLLDYSPISIWNIIYLLSYSYGIYCIYNTSYTIFIRLKNMIYNSYLELKNDFNTYFVREEKELTQCSICLEEIIPSDSFKLNCKHVFDSKCIHKWASSRMNEDADISCPLCKQDIFILKEFKIYSKYSNNKTFAWCFDEEEIIYNYID